MVGTVWAWGLLSVHKRTTPAVGTRCADIYRYGMREVGHVNVSVTTAIRHRTTVESQSSGRRIQFES